MPRLPDTLDRRPIPQPSTSVASPQYGEPGEAYQAQAMATAGRNFEQASEDFLKLQQQESETKVNDLYVNQYIPEAVKQSQDFYAKQGKAAVEAMPKYVFGLSQQRSAMANTLTDPYERKLFDQKSSRHLEMELETAARYSDQQQKVYDLHTHQSELNQLARQAANQPEFLEATLAQGKESIWKYAQNRQSPEIRDDNYAAWVSQTVSDTINNQLAANNPNGALDIYKKYSGLIDAKQRLPIENRVRESWMVADVAGLADKRIEQALAGIPEQKGLTQEAEQKAIKLFKKASEKGVALDVTYAGAIPDDADIPADAKPGKGINIRVDTTALNTSGIPNARDVKALLPTVLADVEVEANKRYGKSSTPERAEFVQKYTNALTARINREVAQLDAIQKRNQGDLIDFIAGFTTGEKITSVGQITGAAAPGGMTQVTSMDQIYTNPTMLAKWNMIDPQAKVGLENLIHHNAVQGKGNDALYWEAWNRIHADPNDPKKIDFYQQILDYAGPGKLNVQQIGQLRQEIDRNETPGGRSVNQLMKMGAANAQTFFKTTPMFTAQPDRQIAATMRWTEDAGKRIDEYVAAGKPVRTLFMVDSPDSIVSPKFLQTYIDSTPSQALAAQAASVKAGQGFTAEQIAKFPQVPNTIKSREEGNKWLATLPADVMYFRDENGIPRAIPGRVKAMEKGK